MPKEFKIDRSSFLYVQPTTKSYGDPKDYAQCKTCMMWTTDKGLTCTIHGSKEVLEVFGPDTCAWYVNGKPMPSMIGKEHVSVTVEQSGFERRLVQCHRCYWYSSTLGLCGLYVKLNQKFPRIFDLDPSVHKNGCCNSQAPLDAKFNSENFLQVLNKKVSLKDLI